MTDHHIIIQAQQLFIGLFIAKQRTLDMGKIKSYTLKQVELSEVTSDAGNRF